MLQQPHTRKIARDEPDRKKGGHGSDLIIGQPGPSESPAFGGTKYQGLRRRAFLRECVPLSPRAKIGPDAPSTRIETATLGALQRQI